MAYNRDSSLPVLWSSGRCDAEEESPGEAPGQEDVVRGEVHEPLEAAPVSWPGLPVRLHQKPLTEPFTYDVRTDGGVI